jgi:hypothetical protein
LKCIAILKHGIANHSDLSGSWNKEELNRLSALTKNKLVSNPRWNIFYLTKKGEKLAMKFMGSK